MADRTCTLCACEIPTGVAAGLLQPLMCIVCVAKIKHAMPDVDPWGRYDDFVRRKHVDDNGCWIPHHVPACGYVSFTHQGRIFKLHRLSVEKTLGRAMLPGMYACHACDNPPCFNPDHLWEGTQQENDADKFAKMRHAHGERVGGSKLTEDQVRAILEIPHSIPNTEVAAIFDVTSIAVSQVRLGRNWKHIFTEETRVIPTASNLIGRLTDEEAIEIRNSDEACIALAERYGISRTLVSRIQKGTSFGHVKEGRIRGADERSGHKPVGDESCRSKLTETDVREILSDPITPNKVIAENFGITTSMVARIRRNAAWTHIPREGFPNYIPQSNGKPGHVGANRKLADEDVLDIYTSNEVGRALSKKYGVTESVISSIRTGKAWVHITGTNHEQTPPLGNW